MFHELLSMLCISEEYKKKNVNLFFLGGGQSQIFGQENKGSQIFRGKLKGSQINFKV